MTIENGALLAALLSSSEDYGKNCNGSLRKETFTCKKDFTNYSMERFGKSLKFEESLKYNRLLFLPGL